MQISKPLFATVIIFTVLLSAALGYTGRMMQLDDEKAELEILVVELEQEIDSLQLQLAAAEAELESGTQADPGEDLGPDSENGEEQ